MLFFHIMSSKEAQIGPKGDQVCSGGVGSPGFPGQGAVESTIQFGKTPEQGKWEKGYQTPIEEKAHAGRS